MKHHVIYVPGLGDGFDAGRRWALKIWQLYGVQAELVAMHWDDEPAYQPKYDRVTQAVKAATQRGKTVSLVADSAGASIALNVLANHPELHRVVTICGVNSSTIPLRAAIKSRNPALDDSVRRLASAWPRITNRDQVVSLVAFADLTVNRRYSLIRGVSTRQIPVVGHIAAIAFCLSFYAWRVCWLVRQP